MDDILQLYGNNKKLPQRKCPPLICLLTWKT